MKLSIVYNVTGALNTYILGNENSTDAIIIDPGQIDIYLIKLLEENNYYLRSILITHNHKTHTVGVKTLLKIYEASIYSKTPLVEGFKTVAINDGDLLKISGFNISVIGVPGHSHDSLVFKVDNALFTGDVISAGKAGYTTKSESKKELQENVEKKLFSLDEHLLVFPGHGPPTSLKIEKKFSPFVRI